MNPPTRTPDQPRRQRELLLLPAQARAIIEIARNDRAPVKSLAEAIGAEPVFAARLLRLANFAPGLAQRLTTVPQMVNAFGVDNLKPLALGLSAFAAPAAPAPSGAVELRNLWEHALGSAVVAGRFAARIHGVSPLAAFVAGFVHDIGKVLLHGWDAASYAEAVKISRQKTVPSTEAESLAIGSDHVQTGAAWGAKVELAPAFQMVLRFHHEPIAELPPDIDDCGRRLIAAVQAGEMACEAEGIGDGGDFGPVSRETRQALGLEPEAWREELRGVKEAVESVREFFGFPVFMAERKEDVSPAKPSGEKPAAQTRAAGGGGRAVVVPFPIRAHEAAQNTEKRPPGKLAILVVEDHGSLCDLLSLYFMRHGYHVRTASDGGGALEILSRETIHLVLLDLMLPWVDGFEVLKQIQQTGRGHTPYIIVVSAGASERDRQKVLDLGANEYMAKPFHLLRLLERVQTIEKFLL